MTLASTALLLCALICMSGIAVAILTYRAFELRLRYEEKRLAAGDEDARDQRVASLERDVKALSDRLDAAEKATRDNSSALAMRGPRR